MERGGFNGHQTPDQQYFAGGNALPQPVKLPHVNTAAAMAAGDQEEERERPDIYMPTANVLRIMRTILPANAKVSDEVRRMVQECTNEFIGFVTAEAAAGCNWESRKTITGNDLLSALARLGFKDYLPPLAVFLRRYKEVDGDRRRCVQGPPPPPYPSPLPMQFYADPTPTTPKFPFPGGGGDGGYDLLRPPPSFIIPPQAQPKPAGGVELYPLPNELYRNVAGGAFASMSDSASASGSSIFGSGSTSHGSGGYGEFGYGHGFYY